MKLLFISFFFLIFKSSFSQDSVSLINSHVSKVNLLVKANKLTLKEYQNMSFCGGALTGYFQNGELIYIKTVYAGEMGATFTDWYLNNGKIIYMKEVHSEYIPPKDFNDYCKKHHDKNGNCDFSGLKNTEEIHKTYFLQNPKIIHSIDNKTINLNSEEINNYILNSINCLSSLIEELNETQ